ncbi:hypothetical protein LOY67_12410 [Pseudomonas sp. B21-056]|uniref:hypothetical protein n=1 Tax=Pseudomonas sp. B21-056 TaxID=2895495 RepID=UPI002230D20B|nr:hypothetical protein [Pseudomonas sp. B21-056]UZE26166.1 hypothetical protein LOY67_12410 [Pseudomonas sp. B21-056]
MKGKYRTAFIVPEGARKKLSDDGWEFESASRLSLDFKERLIDHLDLSYLNEYLGIEAYCGADLEVGFFYDDDHQVEFVHLKMYGDVQLNTLELLGELVVDGSFELFVPAEPEK